MAVGAGGSGAACDWAYLHHLRSRTPDHYHFVP